MTQKETLLSILKETPSVPKLRATKAELSSVLDKAGHMDRMDGSIDIYLYLAARGLEESLDKLIQCKNEIARLSHDVFDVLDRDNSDGGWAWTITYMDGKTRSSQYRNDLIRDEDRTALTRRAFEVWPEWKGAVLG